MYIYNVSYIAFIAECYRMHSGSKNIEDAWNSIRCASGHHRLIHTTNKRTRINRKNNEKIVTYPR